MPPSPICFQHVQKAAACALFENLNQARIDNLSVAVCGSGRIPVSSGHGSNF